MSFAYKYYYIDTNGAELFTAVLLPEDGGKYPTVVYRSPYEEAVIDLPETDVCERLLNKCQGFLARGYAVVYQHCRGTSKSRGVHIPYINEREDGLALHEWIRKESFYNGEIFLHGASYTSSVHYCIAPFAPDIKGAVLEVQDCERYNCNYRNGFFKVNLHGTWYLKMYKRKEIPLSEKIAVPELYNTYPLSEVTLVALGERSPDLDAILAHPDRDDPFWDTRLGGKEARDAVKHANIPILFTTAHYDIYTGGVFDMWRGMDEGTRAKCALAVNPYDHGGSSGGKEVVFENGMMSERFPDFVVNWFDFIRGKRETDIPQGKVTYYDIFGGGWRSDDYYDVKGSLTLTLGEGERSYTYNPYMPASFKGGLSCNFGGTAYQDQPHKRKDIITLYTPAFESETRIKGRITANLTVRSDCGDTCFYMRLSLVKPDGDYGLRDDITKLSNFNKSYVAGEEQQIAFEFDEHSFTVAKGEMIRIDISSSSFPHYLPHTNRKGDRFYAESALIAHNTVVLSKSSITLPICEN